MEIKQLKCAIAIAKHLSFSEAGIETSFSTSAVSKQLSGLEEELGLTLFTRKGKSQVQLTSDGRLLLPHFQKIIREYEEMIREAGSLSSSYNSTLSVASPLVFPPNIEAELFEEFMRDNPGVSLNMAHYSLTSMIDLLYSGKIDLCMETILGKLSDNSEINRLAEDENLASITLMVRDDFFIIHPQNPLSQSHSVRLEDLAVYPDLFYLFVSPYPDSLNVRKTIFLRECKKLGFTPKTVDLYYDHGVAALMARYIGMNPNAAALLPDLEYNFKNVVRVRLESDAFTPTTIVLYLKTNRSKALKSFTATARRVAGRHLFNDL